MLLEGDASLAYYPQVVIYLISSDTPEYWLKAQGSLLSATQTIKDVIDTEFADSPFMPAFGVFYDSYSAYAIAVTGIKITSPGSKETYALVFGNTQGSEKSRAVTITHVQWISSTKIGQIS